MRPVSPRFLSALTGSHRQVLRVIVPDGYQEGVSPTGTDLVVFDGSCTFDAASDVRGRLELTVDGRTDWPKEPTALLAPYGSEVFVSRGIEFGHGHTEMVSQGYFRIQTLEQTGNPRHPLRIEAMDRMQGLVEARMEQPRQFIKGTTIEAIFTNLVGEVYPDFTLECDEAAMLAYEYYRSQICEEDRYKFLNDIARSWGKIMYWDYRGILVIKDPPDPQDIVYRVRGGQGGVLTAATRRLTREGVYNSAVVTGEGPDEKDPARGVVRDMNPRSPTYWHGPFGKRPKFFSTPLIETDSQAVAAARTMLAKMLGMPYTLDFSVVPNPALEPFDPVLVRVEDDSGSYDRLHILDSVTVPLDFGSPVTCKTRLQVNTEELSL